MIDNTKKIATLFLLLFIVVFFLPLKIVHVLPLPYETLLGNVVTPVEEFNDEYPSTHLTNLVCLLFHFLAILNLFFKSSRLNVIVGMISAFLQIPMLLLLYLLLWFDLELFNGPILELHFGIGYYLLCLLTLLMISINVVRFAAQKKNMN